MGFKLNREPKLRNPVMIAGWPGIGNIGMVAIDTLRETLKAEEFGEIESWDFLYPNKAVIRKGILEYLEFPGNKFYFAKAARHDLIIFIGEEQPTNGGKTYAEGKNAYIMANLVLDVAQKFGCRRIYTSGAAVSLNHHTMKPRVWVVPSSEHLIREIKGYDNTVLMSDIEKGGGQGNITGLNGLLLGVAKKRGFEAICAMGEIPTYLQGLPLPYPKASISVLEFLSSELGIDIDIRLLDESIERIDQRIDEFYRQIPLEIRSLLEKLKYMPYDKPAEPGPITEEDKKKVMEDIEQFFKKKGNED